MKMPVTLLRQIQVPDDLRAARFRAAPQLGPRLLFFSGGSALKKLSQRLVEFSHNSIHIITPFDSGGSSAVLRNAFDMPAVGDIRNRLMALTDQSLLGNSAVQTLFGHRLAANADSETLHQALHDLMAGNMPLLADVANPMRKIIRNHLGYLYKRLPSDFDLAGASIGNLVLAGGYLMYRRHLDPVIFIFSKLADVRGIVRPVVNQPLHLAAELADGRVVIGQHRLGGKQMPSLTSRIKRLMLSVRLEQMEPARPAIRTKTRDLIQTAELICYPMGSFYSSLIANLLPSGTGRAVGANPCPKVFIPNTGHDPELLGHTLLDQVQLLLDYLRQDYLETVESDRLLNLVIVDPHEGGYPGGIPEAALNCMGIQVIQTRLVTSASHPHIDENLLIPVLLGLI